MRGAPTSGGPASDGWLSAAHPPRHEGRWRRFVRRYGWRAYALPILAAITVTTLVQGLPASADRAHAATKNAAAKRSGVVIEGAGPSSRGYTAGSTPAPVTITLDGDQQTCADSTYPSHIIVSINQQHLWACDGHKQVLQTAVTTGSSVNNDQTPLGSWRVEGLQRDRYLVGPGYRDYVNYWMPFNGDFGLHDAPWEKTGYGSQDYRTMGSHGCVHVPRADMAWLYNWAKISSTVVTIEA